MRCLSLLTLSAGLLLLAGCESIEPSRGLQLAAVQPQSNYYARPKTVVFDALVAVLEKMDYTIAKALPAQGMIEAYGHLLEADTPGDARQFMISARVRDVGHDQSGVELIVREAREGDFKSGPTNETHAQHGRYDSIFEALEQALGEGSWLPPANPTPGSAAAH